MNRKLRTFFSPDNLVKYLFAAVSVAVTTGLMLIIGRDKLGEAVIALVFLIPVGWSAGRLGQGPGIFAAVSAALAFDFFFIPPFNTLAVAQLESWLVLVIFLVVAILVVGRIQSSLSQAQTSEHEAIFMYELSAALAGLRTQEAVAHTSARFIQERYLPDLVTVVLQPRGKSSEITVYEPQNGKLSGNPDRVLPILNNWGLVGEIQIWGRDVDLPSTDSRLFRNFATQIGQAIERTQLIEAGVFLNPTPDNINFS